MNLTTVLWQKCRTPFHAWHHLDVNLVPIIESYMSYSVFQRYFTHWLVMMGLSDNYKDALVCACREGDMTFVQTLMNCKVVTKEHILEVKPRQFGGCILQKLFRNAVISGHLDLVKYLFQFVGNNVHAQHYLVTFGYNSPLQRACEYNRLPVAKFLVSYGADVSKGINLAASKGHIEMVHYLVAQGADITIDDYAPFRYACYYGYMNIVTFLLSKCQDDKKKKINMITAYRNYPLRWATCKGHFDIVKLLLTEVKDQKLRCDMIHERNNYRPRGSRQHDEIEDYLITSASCNGN